MKLADLLETLDPGEKVFIGAADGSGFVVIGKAKELELADIDKRRLKELRQAVRKTRVLVNNKKAMIRRYRESIEKLGSTDELAVLLASAESCNREYEATLTRLLGRLESYQPLSERPVSETYPKLIEPGTVIIVSGKEEGFWLEEEFNRWQRRG